MKIWNLKKDLYRLNSQDKAMLRVALEKYLSDKNFKITPEIKNSVKTAVLNKYNGKAGNLTSE